MSEKIFIGGTPMFDNPFTHCTFLGRFGGHDLYLTQSPGKSPDVLARSGQEPGEYVEGLKLAWGQSKPLTAARRIAQYKRLLPLDPVAALFHAHEPEDLVSIRKALLVSLEYAALTAFQSGDVAAADQLLDQLVAHPDMVTRYPTRTDERLRHVDLHLTLVGRFLDKTFSAQTYTGITAPRLAALEGSPRAATAAPSLPSSF
jgi:hypothetical protein